MEEINFENFNISENNIISVELAKVLRYLLLFSLVCPWPGPSSYAHFGHRNKTQVAKCMWAAPRIVFGHHQKHLGWGKGHCTYNVGGGKTRSLCNVNGVKGGWNFFGHCLGWWEDRATLVQTHLPEKKSPK